MDTSVCLAGSLFLQVLFLPLCSIILIIFAYYYQIFISFRLSLQQFHLFVLKMAKLSIFQSPFLIYFQSKLLFKITFSLNSFYEEYLMIGDCGQLVQTSLLSFMSSQANLVRKFVFTQIFSGILMAVFLLFSGLTGATFGQQC